MIVFRVALAVGIFTLACALFLVKRVPWLLFLAMYILELSIQGTGFGISIAQPDQRTAAMIALALIVPFCFIDRTIASIAVEGIEIVAYAIIGKGVVSPSIYSGE